MDTKTRLTPLLTHLAFVFSRQTDQNLQEQLGAGLAQYKILMMIQDNPHIQQRDIAGSFGQTEASISRQIKLMKQKGWLIVQTNLKNRRQHLSVLTQKGQRLTEAADATYGKVYKQALGSLSDKQKTQLYDLLALIHQKTCEPGQTAACDPILQIWQKA